MVACATADTHIEPEGRFGHHHTPFEGSPAGSLPKDAWGTGVGQATAALNPQSPPPSAPSQTMTAHQSRIITVNACQDACAGRHPRAQHGAPNHPHHEPTNTPGPSNPMLKSDSLQPNITPRPTTAPDHHSQTRREHPTPIADTTQTHSTK